MFLIPINPQYNISHQSGSVKVSPVSTSGPQLDVQGSDPQLLAPLSHILSRQHRSIRGGLVSVGLHLHPTSNTADRFSEDQEEGKLNQKMITTRMQHQITSKDFIHTQKLSQHHMDLNFLPRKYWAHNLMKNKTIGLYKRKNKI